MALRNCESNTGVHDTAKGMVVLPYVEGVTENLQIIFCKHNIPAAMRPHNTLKKLLVHPIEQAEHNTVMWPYLWDSL